MSTTSCFAALCFGCVCLICPVQSAATVLRVPSQFATIQAAIQASQNGDTVLVSSGRYFENIRYGGKRITVASQFLTTGNRDFILTTIIDGSQPSVPDSASVVRLIDGEDSTTVLAGFTITGGRGTKWLDEHGAGTYREGGGILCSFNSPVIRDNFITGNSATDAAGVSGAGGGGLRLGDGNVTLLNNIIVLNSARDYGGGIVLNYCACKMKNNLVAMNTVGNSALGGGGLWINQNAYGAFAGKTRVIENNVIAGNAAGANGGGIKFFAGTTTVRNCILWANTAPSGSQVSGSGTVLYSNVQTALGGTNLSVAPQFADSGFSLLASSPCIDAGDIAASFNDMPNPGNPLQALLPSLGALRNDMGAFGGSSAKVMLPVAIAKLSAPAAAAFPAAPQGSTARLTVAVLNRGSGRLRLDSVAFQQRTNGLNTASAFPLTIAPAATDSIVLQWQSAVPATLNDTLLIYHRDTTTVNPLKLRLSGTATSDVESSQNPRPNRFELSQNYPNPFNPETNILYELGAASEVSLKVFDVLGREVRTLVNERKPAGNYRVRFDATGLASGTYFYRLAVYSPASGSSNSGFGSLNSRGGFAATKQMNFVK